MVLSERNASCTSLVSFRCQHVPQSRYAAVFEQLGAVGQNHESWGRRDPDPVFDFQGSHSCFHLLLLSRALASERCFSLSPRKHTQKPTMSIFGFASRWVYPLGCLFFFATRLSPFQQACATGMALSVVLSQLFFWIVVHYAHLCHLCFCFIARYGVPVGVLVFASLQGPAPNVPFASNDALANGVCLAVIVASVLKLLWPALTLACAVVVRPPAADGRPVLTLRTRKAVPTSTCVGPSSVVEPRR